MLEHLEVATLADFLDAIPTPLSPRGSSGFGGAGTRRVIQFIFDGIDRVSPIVQAIGQGINSTARASTAAGAAIASGFAQGARNILFMNTALQAGTRVLDRFSSQFVETDGRLKQVGFSALFLGLNMQNMGRTMIRAGQQVLAGVTGIFNIFKDMDTAARRVLTQTNASGQEALGQLERQLLSVTTRVPQSFQAVADAAYEVFSTIPAATRQPAEAFKIVEASARAATAGFIDLGEAARFGSQIINAFGETNIVKVFDEMFTLLKNAPGTFAELVKAIQAVTPAAAVTRQSFQDTAAILGVLARDIGNVSIAGTQLRNIFQAFSRRDVQQQLKKINVEVFNSEGRFRSMISIIEDLGKRLDGLSDAGRVRALQLIFGGKTGNIPLRQLGIDILLRNFAELRELQKKLANGQTELDTAFQKTLGPAAAIEIAFNNLRAAAFEFGASSAGIMINFAQSLIVIARVLGNLPGPVKQFGVIAGIAFGGLLITLGPVALLLGSVLTSVVALAQLSNLGFISDAFGRMGISIFRAFGALTILLAGLGLLIFYHEQIGNAIQNVWEHSWMGNVAVLIAALLVLIRVLQLVKTTLIPLGILIQLIFGKVLLANVARAVIFVGSAIVNLVGLAIARILLLTGTALAATALQAVAAAAVSTPALFAIGLAAIAVIALILAAVTGGLAGVGNFIQGVVGGIAGFLSNIGTYAAKATAALKGLLSDPFSQSREDAEKLNEALSAGAGDAQKFGNAVKGAGGELSNLNELEKANKAAQDAAYRAALKRFRGNREALKRAQIDVQRDAAGVQIALEREREILQDMQADLQDLTDEWNKAKQAMQEYVDVLLPGERKAENAIFKQEQVVKALRLQILQLGENAGEGASQFLSMADALEAFNRTVDQFNLDRVLDRRLIDQLRGLFTGSVGPGNTLQDQLEAAERQLEILRLQTELTFDPLHRALEQAADTTKTMTFEEAIAGIHRSRAEMDRLEPSIERATAAVERQQDKVDALEKRYRALRHQARGLGVDLGEQGLDRPFSTPAIDASQLPDLNELTSQAGANVGNIGKLNTQLSDMNFLGGFADDMATNLGKIEGFFKKMQDSIDRFNTGLKGQLGKPKSMWDELALSLGEIWAGLNGDLFKFRERNGDAINGWTRLLNVVLSAPKRAWQSFWDILDSILFSGNRDLFKGLRQLREGFRDNLNAWLDRNATTRDRFDRIWKSTAKIAQGAWNIMNGIVQKGMNVVISIINSFIKTVNATGLVKLGLLSKVGEPKPSGDGGGTMRPLARGGVVDHAQMAVVGEGDAPETVIPWDKKHRKRAVELWEMTARKLGIPGFQTGGVLGRGLDFLKTIGTRAVSYLEEIPLIKKVTDLAKFLSKVPGFPGTLFTKGYPGVPAARGVAKEAYDSGREKATTLAKLALGKITDVPKSVLDWAMKNGLGDLQSLFGGGTGGGGSVKGLVGYARAAWNIFQSRFHLPMGGWRPTGSVPGSDHPKGKAIDIMTSNAVLHEAIIALGKQLPGAKYWISRDRIANAPSWAVRGYSHPSGNSPTLRHMDHVHWSFYRNGGMIREPIIGVGKSGRRYLFGEYGDEMVIPTTPASGGSTSDTFAESIRKGIRQGIQDSTGTSVDSMKSETHYHFGQLVLPNVKDGQEFATWMEKMAAKSETVK